MSLRDYVGGHSQTFPISPSLVKSIVAHPLE